MLPLSYNRDCSTAGRWLIKKFLFYHDEKIQDAFRFDVTGTLKKVNTIGCVRILQNSIVTK